MQPIPLPHSKLTEIPPFMWINHYLNIMSAGRICNYCFKVPPKVSRCSGCSRVSYCSKECQTKDWNLLHKAVCKDFRKVNAEFRRFGASSAEKNRATRMYGQASLCLIADTNARNGSGGPAAMVVADSIRDQQKCSTCIKSPWELETFDPMIRCEDCLFAWWCSEDCKKEPDKSTYHTPELCKSLREQSAAQHVGATWAIADRSLSCRQFSTRVPKSSYISLNQFSGWDDYGLIDPDVIKWKAEATKEMLQMHPAFERGIMLQIFEAMSIPFTIMAACEDVFPDIPTRTKLCVHLVGAGPRELSVTHCMEQILHFLPSLRSLKLVYVGPRVSQTELLLPLDDGNNTACKACKAAGRSRIIERKSGLYHDLHLAKPDLFLIANPGFGEVEKESWAPTLKYIVNSNVPAVFCSFHETEGYTEERIMKDMGAHIVVPVEKNKWHGVLTSGSIEPGYSAHLNKAIIGHSCLYRYIVRGRA